MLSKEQLELAKSTKLTENFTLMELINSDRHPDLVIFPPEQIIQELKKFARTILQPLRDKFGPIHVNSGWRNQRLNRAVGGEPNSVHQILQGVKFLGVACDIVPREADIIEVFEWMEKGLSESKAKILYRQAKVTRTKFIHVDTGTYRPKPVMLEKIYDEEQEKMIYIPYTKE